MPPGAPDLCYAGTPTPAVSSSRCQIPPPTPPPPPPPPPPLHHLHPVPFWLTLLDRFLPSVSEIVSLSDSHSACHVLSVTPFYPWLPLVCLSHSSTHRHIFCSHNICLAFIRFLTRLALIIESSLATHPFPFTHFTSLCPHLCVHLTVTPCQANDRSCNRMSAYLDSVALFSVPTRQIAKKVKPTPSVIKCKKKKKKKKKRKMKRKKSDPSYNKLTCLIS